MGGSDFVQGVEQEQLLRDFDISECILHLRQGRLGLVERIGQCKPHRKQCVSFTGPRYMCDPMTNSF